MDYYDIRRQILMQQNTSKLDEVKRRSQEFVNKAEALAALMDSLGWRVIVEEFIKPRLSIERIITAQKEMLPYIQHEMKLLQELLTFIDNYVERGKKEKELLMRFSEKQEEF